MNILVSVSCANEFACSMPEVFYVKISQVLAERIKELSNAVTKYQANAIEEFNHFGTWSGANVDDVNEGNFDSFLVVIDKEESRVEIPQLRVTDSGFQWTAVPKHAGDDLALSTKMIPLSLLDTDQSVYIDL
jgi:hypothetical protein